MHFNDLKQSLEAVASAMPRVIGAIRTVFYTGGFPLILR